MDEHHNECGWLPENVMMRDECWLTGEVCNWVNVCTTDHDDDAVVGEE